MKIYENIRELRKKKNITQEELAKKVGYTDRSSIAKIEKGKVDIPYSKIIEFATVFDVQPEELMGLNTISIPSVKLPILGTISCGTPLRTEEDPEDWLELDKDIDADYCLRANGDSMIGADIFPGDILFIKKLNGERPKNGDVVVACIDGDTTLKSVFAYENTVFLQAQNKEYEPIQVDVSDDCQTDLIIQGKLTYVLHKV